MSDNICGVVVMCIAACVTTFVVWFMSIVVGGFIPVHADTLALSLAADDWSVAIGRRITIPRVSMRSCWSPGVGACYHKDDKTISVAATCRIPLSGCNERGVMRHEIGHALGLRHISGDSLMDISCSECIISKRDIDFVRNPKR